MLERITTLENSIHTDKPINGKSNFKNQLYKKQHFARNSNRAWALKNGNHGNTTWQPRWTTPFPRLFSSQPDPRQNNVRPYTGCFTCGGLDHMTRQCPRQQNLYQPPAQSIPAQNVSPMLNPTLANTAVIDGNVRATSNNTKNIPTYIKGAINSNKTYFLLDTGRDTCILPIRLADGLQIRQHKVNLRAANGTPIQGMAWWTYRSRLTTNCYTTLLWLHRMWMQ